MKSVLNRNNVFLLAAFAAYVLLFLFFYPPVFSIRDESYYLAMAEVLKQGKLFIDQTDVLYWLSVPHDGHLGPRYPLGNSLLLLPFTLLGWKSVFLSGLLLHLLSAWIFLKWLRTRGVFNPAAPVLYLFFPVFIFYSRTIMSDMPSLFFFLSAYYFYFHPRSPKWPAGVCLGLTLLLRFSNAAYAAAFLGGIFLGLLKEKKIRDFFPLLAGFLPFVALAGLSNAFYYGSPLKIGYLNAPDFGLHMFWPHLWHYLSSTLLIWPGMLAVFLLSSKTRRIEMWAVVLGAFALCAFCLYLDDFRDPLATRVFAVRYFFPAFPFLLLAYGEFAESLWQRFSWLRSRIFLIIFFLALCGGGAAVHARHQNFLNQQDKLRQTVYGSTEEGSVILFDGNCSELVQTVFGKRIYAPYDTLGDVEKVYERWHGEKNIYLVSRYDIYRGAGFWSARPGELEKIKARFQLTEIASEGGLWVDRISADK